MIEHVENTKEKPIRIPIGKMLNKINELVDKVNELELQLKEYKSNEQ